MRKTYTFSTGPHRANRLVRWLIRLLFRGGIVPNQSYEVRVEYDSGRQPLTVRYDRRQIEPLDRPAATVAADPDRPDVTDGALGAPEPATGTLIETVPLDVFGAGAADHDPAPAGVPSDAPASRYCQWCSTPIAPDAAICPRCGSQPIGDPDRAIPGLTDLRPADAAALARPLRKRARKTNEAQAADLAAEVIRHVLDDR